MATVYAQDDLTDLISTTFPHELGATAASIAPFPHLRVKVDKNNLQKLLGKTTKSERDGVAGRFRTALAAMLTTRLPKNVGIDVIRALSDYHEGSNATKTFLKSYGFGFPPDQATDCFYSLWHIVIIHANDEVDSLVEIVNKYCWFMTAVCLDRMKLTAVGLPAIELEARNWTVSPNDWLLDFYKCLKAGPGPPLTEEEKVAREEAARRAHTEYCARWGPDE